MLLLKHNIIYNSFNFIIAINSNYYIHFNINLFIYHHQIQIPEHSHCEGTSLECDLR